MLLNKHGHSGRSGCIADGHKYGNSPATNARWQSSVDLKDSAHKRRRRAGVSDDGAPMVTLTFWGLIAVTDVTSPSLGSGLSTPRPVPYSTTTLPWAAG